MLVVLVAVGCKSPTGPPPQYPDPFADLYGATYTSTKCGPNCYPTDRPCHAVIFTFEPLHVTGTLGDGENLHARWQGQRYFPAPNPDDDLRVLYFTGVVEGKRYEWSMQWWGTGPDHGHQLYGGPEDWCGDWSKMRRER